MARVTRTRVVPETGILPPISRPPDLARDQDGTPAALPNTMAKSKPDPHPLVAFAANATAAAEPTLAEHLQSLRSLLNHKIETSRAIVVELAADLANADRAPLEVLAWSTRAFEAAATLEVALEISKRLDTGEAIGDVYAHIQRNALRRVRSGSSSSTSPAANLASACHTSALAEFEDLLRYAALKTSKMERP